jgi:hypothetical protein
MTLAVTAATCLVSTLAVGGLVAGTAAAGTSASAGSAAPFLSAFHTISKVASTVPSLGSGKPGNGDVNPYGVAVVPRTTGRLVAGDVLVSNFNAASNLQGTGRTIMQISPKGSATLFANLAGQVTGPIGLTTALSVFPNGDVVGGRLAAAACRRRTARQRRRQPGRSMSSTAPAASSRRSTAATSTAPGT